MEATGIERLIEYVKTFMFLLQYCRLNRQPGSGNKRVYFI